MPGTDLHANIQWNWQTPCPHGAYLLGGDVKVKSVHILFEEVVTAKEENKINRNCQVEGVSLFSWERREGFSDKAILE